jgi:hypothetical protein
MLPSWVDLGADALIRSGRIGRDAGAAQKAEARRRPAHGQYFGREPRGPPARGSMTRAATSRSAPD